MKTSFSFRGILTALALAALVGTVQGLANLNIQHYARGTPLEVLLDYLGPSMSWLKDTTTDPRFLVLTSLVVGGSLFLWADVILRNWAAWRDRHRGVYLRKIDRRLLAMTFVFIFGSGLVVSIIWLAVESRMRPATKSVNAAKDPLAAELIKARSDNAEKDQQIEVIQKALDDERKSKTTQPRDRTAIKAQLQNFYARGSEIVHRPIRKDISEADWASYVAEASKWINETAIWIEGNLGPSGLAKFRASNMSSMIGSGNGINEKHDALLTNMNRYLENLGVLMESGAYDKG